MNINIKTKGEIQLTNDITDYLDKKLHSLSKFLQHPDSDPYILAELKEGESAQERKYRVDITIELAGSRTHAVGWGETLFSAIDAAKDELSGRMRREHKKQISLLKKAGRKFKDMIRGIKR